MTAFDRFDPFERRITGAILEIAAERAPDYLDHVFQRTARSSQRPRWSFLERWLPMDTTLSRLPAIGRLPIRPLVILALLAALLAATLAAYVGSHRGAPPFGPAANGALAYQNNGDLYVRDTPTSPGRFLVGGPGVESAPYYAPDGTHLTYVSTVDGVDHLMVANADGSGAVEIAVLPDAANTFGAISPDGKTFALIYPINGVPTLSLAAMDGRSSRVIEMNHKSPLEVLWSPPNGDRLLVRARDEVGDGVDLYTVKADGTDVRAFDLDGNSDFGPVYTLAGMSWSPDGKTIAYNGVDDSGLKDSDGTPRDHFRLHLVDSDGTNDRAVPGPTDPTVQENWPLYSPDGQWIVVNRWSFYSGAGGVAILPADGSQAGRPIGPQDVGGDLGKTWSPDGTRLLMVVQDVNPDKVFSIDPVTGTYELLDWTYSIPDWQRRAP
jgi:Tol biopolymer transport system component